MKGCDFVLIPVSEPFLPPIAEYNKLIQTLWESRWLTNNGIYVQELEKRLKEHLQIPSIFFVSNGTIGLQLALNALRINGEVITTPFSFVATTASIIWENNQPVFVDIDPDTLCIDVNKIERVITDETKAILATHVFGIPCDVEKIQELAEKYNLRVIYDAAHAFGVKYRDKSLLRYGDISVLSFHATKLFHTVEGGGIVNNVSNDIGERIQSLRSFGYENEHFHVPGINGKNSEFHAAMGLCNLGYVDLIVKKRKELTEVYDTYLISKIKRPKLMGNIHYNYAYYPIIFRSEEQLLRVKLTLESHSIQTRRYFYPSLNKLPYINEGNNCPISEDISKRILCLPLYDKLTITMAKKIATLILEEIRK